MRCFIIVFVLMASFVGTSAAQRTDAEFYTSDVVNQVTVADNTTGFVAGDQDYRLRHCKLGGRDDVNWRKVKGAFTPLHMRTLFDKFEQLVDKFDRPWYKKHTWKDGHMGGLMQAYFHVTNMEFQYDEDSDVYMFKTSRYWGFCYDAGKLGWIVSYTQVIDGESSKDTVKRMKRYRANHGNPVEIARD